MFLGSPVIKSAVCLLLLCLLTGGMANGTVFGQSPADAGILKVNGSGSVLVNGNPATTGTVILTDSQIQTQGTAGASVDFARLGRVVVGCNSTASVTFSGDSIHVTAVSGFASLTSRPGVNGTIVLPDGKSLMTDVAAGSTVETATGNRCCCRTAPIAKSEGLPSVPAFGLASLILGGAALTALIIATTKGNNTVVSTVGLS